MDLALHYSATHQAYDLAISGTDLAGDDTLASAARVSLMADRLAEAYEVGPTEDRRGWWADSFNDGDHKTGSRIWLLQREKQLQGTINRCRQFCQEAMQWFVDDGIAERVTVTVFAPRTGWLIAMIAFVINGRSRTLRFEFTVEGQTWRLSQESFNAG